MAYAGLRSVEVANTGPDHLTGRRLFLPVCKGGGQGWVTLPDWVALEVAAADPWQVTPPTVRRVVGSVMRDAGVTGTPHQLRHWFGTTTLRACGNLRVVQGLMRHASPASTALYTLVEDTERTAVVDSLPRLTPGPVPTHTLEDTR
jgi:integrase